jgi:hypothetical protein
MNTSNNQFDWNVNNYSLQELEEIFQLPASYTESMVQTQTKKLNLSMENDVSSSSFIKQKTSAFINQAKEILLKNIKNINSNNSSSSQTNSTISELNNIFNVENVIPQNQIADVGSTYVIRQPVIPYAHAFPSDFNPGILNPINKRILKQNITIDTRFRDNYYGTLSSNFNFDLPLKINGVVSLQLAAMELPNTFYVISNVFANNFFVVEIQGYNPVIVQIPDGNYDYLALQEYLNNFFTNNTTGPYKNIQVLTDFNTPGGSGNPAGSGRMIFGSITGDQQFSINFLTDIQGNDDRGTPLQLKLGWLMGFREGYYENAFTYVSEGIVNLNGPSYIYLVVDDYNNNVNDGFYSAFNSSILNKNILARISLQGSVFNVMSQNNLNLITTPREYFGPVVIQKLNVQLLDPYGRVINLNNMDYSFCLTFQSIYNL